MALKLTSYYNGKDIPALPGNNIFHSKELFLFYEATSSYTPILIVASVKGKPVAKLLAVIRKSARVFPLPFQRKCEIFGTGEYLDDNINKEDVFGSLLEHLTTEALRHAFVIEFRNLENALDEHKHFRLNKYFAINWLRVRNSLHKTDQIENQFSPSRIRQIKRGLKNGAEVYETNNEQDIFEFSRMLHRIYSARIRKHLPSLEFFQLMNPWLISKGLAKLFIVKYNNRIIGGSCALYSGENAYLWFSGGMTKRYALQSPGILAIWAALTDAKCNGCKYMEFIDVGLPFKKHGFRNFILRFGGKQSSTRRWFRIRWNLLNELFIKIHS